MCIVLSCSVSAICCATTENEDILLCLSLIKSKFLEAEIDHLGDLIVTPTELELVQIIPH